MVQSVRGQFRDQVAHPAAPVERRDGQGIIITFVPSGAAEPVLYAVRGRFRDGVGQPVEAVDGREGQDVIITFVEERLNHPPASPEESEVAWKALESVP